MSRMLKSSGAMAAATLSSRLLGMVREMVYAAFMGSTWVAAAFMLAFQIPNLFRRLLGEGALTAAFIPIFKHKERKEGEAEMWRSANAVISGLMAAAGVVTVLVVIGLSITLAVGDFRRETELMLRLLRLMFPYMLLVCLAAVLIGMANARGHFFVPALGAVVLNLVMIASVVFLAPLMGKTLQEQIRALAIGVVFAGLAQAFMQFPLLKKEGFRYEWVSPWRDPTVRDVVRKMIPGSIGVAAFQINVLATQAFSFWYDSSIVATFNYAVRLMELPQGLFGISLATYLLPTLSGLAADRNYGEFRKTLNQGLSYLAFVNILAAAVSLCLAVPIVRLIFERGLFGPEETRRSALALACLAPGLLAYSMNNILSRAFFALEDIKTPMRISVACLVINLGFSIWLVQPYREAGLGVANSLTSWINTGLLLYALRKKLKRLDIDGFARSLLTLVPAALLAGAVGWFGYDFWKVHAGTGTLLLKIGAVFVPGAAAGLVYLAIALMGKVPAAGEITKLITRRQG